MKRSHILDAWALMAFFENTPAAPKVERVILDAHARDTPLIMSVVNAGELWYSTARAYSAVHADALIEELDALGIEIVAVDW